MPPGPSADECATLVMDVVPPVMRAIRTEMRRQGSADLSVPALRTLLYLARRDGASLSEAAEHIGLTLPSASRLVDGLVDRGLVRRRTSATDRRRVTLGATPKGRNLMESVRAGAQARMAKRIADLSPESRASVVRGLEALRPLFTAPVRSEPGRA